MVAELESCVPVIWGFHDIPTWNVDDPTGAQAWRVYMRFSKQGPGGFSHSPCCPLTKGKRMIECKGPHLR